MPGKVLILTAAYGDGHNAAARNLARALWALDRGVQVEVADLFRETLGPCDGWFRTGYRTVTTFFPRCWSLIFALAGSEGFSRASSTVLFPLRFHLRRKLKRFGPDVVVSAYPLYPSLLSRVLRDRGPGGGAAHGRPECVTVITDSISVHALWTRGLTDRYFVTDPLTAEALVAVGVEPARVSALGFPVSHETPAAGRGAAAAPDGAGGLPGSSWRVLFFPSQSRKTVCGQLRELAARVGRDGRLTVVLGRHDRRLRPAVEAQIERLAHPGITLHGWVPEAWRLMGRHDVVVGKAGGATVHEARACRVPMLIDKVVPGQEEGNADLVRMSGTGWVVPRGGSFAETLGRALTADAVGAARRALGDLPPQNATLEIARVLIDSANGKP